MAKVMGYHSKVGSRTIVRFILPVGSLLPSWLDHFDEASFHIGEVPAART